MRALHLNIFEQPDEKRLFQHPSRTVGEKILSDEDACSDLITPQDQSSNRPIRDKQTGGRQGFKSLPPFRI